MTQTSLIADIGGTNARFALVAEDRVREERVLACADYPSPTEAAKAYLDLVKPATAPSRGAFAVASPVLSDRVSMTNLSWDFSITQLGRDLGLERLDVINDFTAVALAMPELTAADRVQIGGGEAVEGMPIGVLGPGSGLGVSALVPGSGGWTALATEGGHVTMPALDNREAAVLALLRGRFGHVSAERLLSGPGLVNLYEALAEVDGFDARELTAAEISDRGVKGSDAGATAALEMFCGMLGGVAGNLALSLGARAGVYVAGGIPPRILPFLKGSSFRHRFEEKGRMRLFLAPIPTYVVTHPYPAFLGLRAQLRKS